MSLITIIYLLSVVLNNNRYILKNKDIPENLHDALGTNEDFITKIIYERY